MGRYFDLVWPEFTYVVEIHPFLISTHSMASHQFHRTSVASGIQAVVISRYLLPLSIRKHLISAVTVAVAHAYIFAIFPTHSIEALIRFHVFNLQYKKQKIYKSQIAKFFLSHNIKCKIFTYISQEVVI